MTTFCVRCNQLFECSRETARFCPTCRIKRNNERNNKKYHEDPAFRKRVIERAKVRDKKEENHGN